MFVFDKIFNKPAQTRHISHYRLMREQKIDYNASVSEAMVPSSDIMENLAGLRHYSLNYDAVLSPLYSTHVGGPFRSSSESSKCRPKGSPDAPVDSCQNDDFEQYLGESREFQKLRRNPKNHRS